jgi:hypothetical protein
MTARSLDEVKRNRGSLASIALDATSVLSRLLVPFHQGLLLRPDVNILIKMGTNAYNPKGAD